jgi:hypothetical protein
LKSDLQNIKKECYSLNHDAQLAEEAAVVMVVVVGAAAGW